MIVHRLVVVLIFTALLTGCGVVNDIKALKADIRAMRIYLMALPAPEQCRGPGMHESSQSCYYRLLISEDKDVATATGLIKGTIDPAVYKENLEDCKKAKSTLREEYKDLVYECLNPEDFPDRNIVYAFQVDGNPKLTAGMVYHFVSVPGSNHLKKLEKAPDKEP